MEVQFNKTLLPCLHTVARETQPQEETQEVRITDGMPDIGSVLASWGQILIRSKEWHSGSVGVSGGVMVWTLYMPEDGGEPQCVESWLPFQIRVDIPDTQRDGAICVLPILRGVDARLLSARKLMVRASVAMAVEAFVSEDMEISTPDQLPEDIQVLTNTYPMMIPKEAGEKAFALEEVFSLPASVPGISKLIRYALRPEILETKVVTDKLVIRGVATLSIMYLDAQGQLQSWELELPFSQYAELDREYDSDATARIWLAVTGLELDRGEEENLNLSAGITAQYVLSEQTMIQLTEDAYSPVRQITPYISGLQMPVVLDDRKESVVAEQSVKMEMLRPVDVCFYGDVPKLHRSGDRVTAELGGTFQVLGYDHQEQLRCTTHRWENEWSMYADPDTRVDVWAQPLGKPQFGMGNGSGNMRTDMTLQVQSHAAQGIPVMNGMTVGEEVEPDPGRPSLILRRAGEDSLWEVAKQTGSTVEAILKANGLQNPPGTDQILLIPVS